MRFNYPLLDFFCSLSCRSLEDREGKKLCCAQIQDIKTEHSRLFYSRKPVQDLSLFLVGFKLGKVERTEGDGFYLSFFDLLLWTKGGAAGSSQKSPNGHNRTRGKKRSGTNQDRGVAGRIVAKYFFRHCNEGSTRI